MVTIVFEILITILLSKMNVEAANEKLRREKELNNYRIIWER